MSDALEYVMNPDNYMKISEESKRRRSAFRVGPNGEWIRVPKDGGWGRVDYLTDGRAWPSEIEDAMEHMSKAPVEFK